MNKLIALSSLLLVFSFGMKEASAEVTDDKKNTAREEAFAKLPQEKASLVKEALGKVRAENKERYEKVRALRQEAKGLFIAPEFDKKTYMAKIKQEETLLNEMHTAKAEALANVATKLSAEERKIVQEGLKPRREKRVTEEKEGGKENH